MLPCALVTDNTETKRQLAALLELVVCRCGAMWRHIIGLHNTWFYFKKGALHTTLSELMIMTCIVIYLCSLDLGVYSGFTFKRVVNLVQVNFSTP